MKGNRFYWSVRRELWEHRSVFYGPLGIAAVVLVAVTVHILRNPANWHAMAALEGTKRAVAMAMPYSIAASVILLSSFIVAVFYCADALNGERRDRSILFWKSMPVSDTISVLAKGFIPFAVLPIVAFGIALATQLLILVMTSGVLPTQWQELRLGQMTIVMAYGVAVHALWYAPIYAWLLLVSAWARRAALLWAVLPVFAAIIAENIALNTTWFASAMRYRVLGAMTEAFRPNALNSPITELSQLEPARFFANQNLWLGLAFAAACIAGAIYLRRRREPT
jgi:ABC-2 type transport system permease protein